MVFGEVAVLELLLVSGNAESSGVGDVHGGADGVQLLVLDVFDDIERGEASVVGEEGELMPGLACDDVEVVICPHFRFAVSN